MENNDFELFQNEEELKRAIKKFRQTVKYAARKTHRQGDGAPVMIAKFVLKK